MSPQNSEVQKWPLVLLIMMTHVDQLYSCQAFTIIYNPLSKSIYWTLNGPCTFNGTFSDLLQNSAPNQRWGHWPISWRNDAIFLCETQAPDGLPLVINSFRAESMFTVPGSHHPGIMSSGQQADPWDSKSLGSALGQAERHTSLQEAFLYWPSVKSVCAESLKRNWKVREM